jgi:uncharacterized membrane protein YgaE (UPF0421/DUF939 family)
MFTNWQQTRNAVVHAVTLSVSCVISYWLITHLLSRAFAVSRDDDLLGGMWAAVATIFVYRFSYEQSIGAAVARIAATSVSFLLCLIYLSAFPFHLWGLATLIGIGAVAMSVIGRPDDIITTGITTVVVMVVAAISPRHPWMQPILRIVDTFIGVGVGIVAAWLSLRTDATWALRNRRIKTAGPIHHQG